MNNLKAVIFLTLLVGVAWAQDCKTDCVSRCQRDKRLCDFFLSSPRACAAYAAQCSNDCNIACECPEECTPKCLPDRQTCLAANSDNVFKRSVCYFRFGICNAECLDECVNRKDSEEDQQIEQSLGGNQTSIDFNNEFGICNAECLDKRVNRTTDSEEDQ